MYRSLVVIPPVVWEIWRPSPSDARELDCPPALVEVSRPRPSELPAQRVEVLTAERAKDDVALLFRREDQRPRSLGISWCWDMDTSLGRASCPQLGVQGNHGPGIVIARDG